MTLAKKTPAKRGRKPKNDSINMIDTASEIIMDEDIEGTRVKPPREQKAGPKKVLSETNKAIADEVAKAVSASTKRANGKPVVNFSEAQSITTPTGRILGRRLPKWLGQYTPKIKMNPDDLADFQEIAVTLGKIALRLILEMLNEYTQTISQRGVQAQQRAVQTQAPQNVQVPQQLRVIRQDAMQQEDVIPANSGVGNVSHPAIENLANLSMLEGA